MAPSRSCFLLGLILRRSGDRRQVCNIRTEDRGAPVFLDVLDHELSTALMANIGPVAAIVSGICQIANQHDVLSEIELQSKLHGSRIGLNIGDTTERAAGQADTIGFSIGSRRQAPASVRE